MEQLGRPADLRCPPAADHPPSTNQDHQASRSTDRGLERVEIRVLGALRVRRADGSLVDPGAWRTGKTADLLRLLAVRSRGMVSVDTLLAELWPDVDEQRGRASLRTAVAQIRRILGRDSVQRRPGGLVLRDVWVDAVAFHALAREARRLVTARQPARLVTVTREAEALYLGEFRAHSDHANWAAAERAELAAAFRDLLSDAADAAVELGWMRDAVEFATRTLAVEPCSERASRALMQGYAGVGETSRALREFERCRVALAEELGADPSPETRSVHLRLLTADPVGPVASPFIGRDQLTLRLRSLIERSLTGRRPAIVLVSGVPDAGKTRLISEACHDISARRVVLLAEEVTDRGLDCVEQLTEALGVASAVDRTGQLDQAIATTESLVVIMAGAGLRQAVDLRRMYAILSKLEGAVTVVLDGVTTELVQGFADLLALDNARTDHRLFHIELHPLRTEEVARLAQGLLGGDIPLPLLDALKSETEGMPGRIVTTVSEWLGAGRVAATAQGLILLPENAQRPVEYTAHQLLAPLLDRLREDDLEVLELMAVFGRPATPLMIAPLLKASDGPIDLDRVARQVQGSLTQIRT